MLGEESPPHGGKGYSEGHADILGKVSRLRVGPRATYKLGWREKGPGHQCGWEWSEPGARLWQEACGGVGAGSGRVM